MQFVSQIMRLLRTDLLLDFRNRYALAGLLLYTLSSVALVYFSLEYQNALGSLERKTWGTFFWLVVLFSAVNAVARSFSADRERQMLYYYQLVRPEVYILSRIAYNVILMAVLSLLALLAFRLMVGSAVEKEGLFLLTVLAGSTGFAILFSLVSAMASKAGQNPSLPAILGFPLVIPLIIFILKLSRESYLEFETGAILGKMAAVVGFDLLLLAMSLVLFPYLWRD